MNSPFQKPKSILTTGLLVVIPVYLALLLLVKFVVHLGVLFKPFTEKLPDWFEHPILFGIVVLLVVSLGVGVLMQTAAGRRFDRWVNAAVLDKIPAYRTLRSLAHQIGELESADSFQPALIDVEDGSLSPAFLIEDHVDGRCTVFMPSVPTPMAGAILIMNRERVFPIDVPLPTMMKCISKWGAGSADLLAALVESRESLGSRTWVNSPIESRVRASGHL